MRWSEEQERVLNGKGNLLVSASAGSGKTTVVIEKVLRLLQEGVDLKRILLITFTRAAAGEMREKLVRKMYEASANNEQVRDQLNNLPFSHIETIHGFCYGIMRKYFNVVGCDPSVVVGEENAMKKALDECVDKVFDEMFTEGDADFLITADFFKQRRSYDAFKETVEKVIAFASNKKDKDAFYELCSRRDDKRIEAYYLTHRKLILPHLIRSVNLFVRNSLEERYDKNVAIYRDVLNRLEEGAKATSPTEFFRRFLPALKLPPKISVTLAKKGTVSFELCEWSGKINKELSDFFGKIEEDREVYLRVNPKQKKIKRCIAQTCQAVEREYAAYKKRRKVIDIQDAVSSALTVLQNEKAREEIAGSFDYIFVDEYQDTDYMQEELIDRLDRGNLFLVGDGKQAIYHFRLSEPRIILRRGERYASGESGTNHSLNTNYRSCREVLDFTNRICNRIMTKDFCGIDYMGTSELHHGKLVNNREGERAVYVYVNREKGEDKPWGTGVYSVRDALAEEEGDKESAFVAQKILSFIGKEIPDGERTRKIGFGDIAVLTRKKKDFKPLFRALNRYGVPCYSLKETDEAFPEREVLIDAVRCVLNATDDIALFNVASSPIGGFTVEELVDLRAKVDHKSQYSTLWESLNTYKGNPKTEEKAKQLISFLEEMRYKCAFFTAEELLTAILAKNYDSYLLGKNADTLRNINAFVSYVGTLAVNASAEEFLSFYDTSFAGNKPPFKEDAVAIMTMHASKGLEFPVVFLPFQHTTDRDTLWQVQLESDLGLAVKAYDEGERTATESFEARVFRLKNKDENRQELSRLMYVAFTRAKNYLVISGNECKVPANVFDGASVLQWILFVAEQDDVIRDLTEDMEIPTLPPEEDEKTERKIFDGSALKREYAFKKVTTMPVKYSVSEILKKQDGFGENPFAYDPASAALGTAIHTVMQHIDYRLKTRKEIERELDELQRRGVLTEEEKNLVPIESIERTLNSEFICHAEKFPCKREQPFMMYVDGEGTTDRVLVQGVIDLLIDEGDGYVVADFKTGGGDERKLKERYAKQLELYAEGVEKILKKPVKKKILYAVKTGLCVEV